MLPIAGQTAGPIELNFFWTHRGGGVSMAKKIRNKFFLFFFPLATLGPLASFKYIFNALSRFPSTYLIILLYGFPIFSRN